jgi:hypothetical protein
MDANSYLSQQLDLVKESLKKSQFHKEARNDALPVGAAAFWNQHPALFLLSDLH